MPMLIRSILIAVWLSVGASIAMLGVAQGAEVGVARKAADAPVGVRDLPIQP